MITASRRTATVLASVLISSLLFGSSGSSAAQPYETLLETHIVETRHGFLYVEVARPVQGDKMIKGPVILTYSPYSVLGRTAHRSRVANGYVVAFADVVGTGNSGGCYDYGGKREKETGYDLVEWLGTQEWSTGKVAMIGGSYNGTTATAAATQQPPHLTTILPQAAISRWYEYAYSGAIRYLANNESPSDEGFDTPIAFDFGFAVPPPLDPQDPNYADRVSSTVTPCEEIEHTEHGYSDLPIYDEFWLERDYIVDADKIDIPVFIAHNWGDWNVKQEEAVNLYRALTNSPKKVLYMGTRYSGHGTPGGDYSKAVDDWFDHYLMGVDNGIDDLAPVTSEMSNFDGPVGWYAGKFPRTTTVKLIAQESTKFGAEDYPWKLLPLEPNAGDDAPVAQFTSTNQNSEVTANEDRHDNASWFWFETPPLERKVRIFGEAEVRVFSTVQREWLTLTPTVVDVNPEGQAFSATRGWLDSRYLQNGRKQRDPIEPGKSFGMTIVEKPQDYTFEKGHTIGLNISTEITEWNVPKPYPCEAPGCPMIQIDWADGQTQLRLPVVDAPAKPGTLFGIGGGQAPPERLPGPRLTLRSSDSTPSRGDRFTFTARLRECKGHAGTKIVLKRRQGDGYRTIDHAKTDRSCEVTFRVRADFKRAVFRATWPKQDEDHRAGRSKPYPIRTH